MSALLPLTGATTFHIPAWLAKATRSLSRTRELFTAIPLPPSAALRGVEGGAGDTRVIRQVDHGSWAVWNSGRLRKSSLASEMSSEGESLSLNCDVSFKADEPEITTG
jgi:hypothetical protein